MTSLMSVAERVDGLADSHSLPLSSHSHSQFVKTHSRSPSRCHRVLQPRRVAPPDRARRGTRSQCSSSARSSSSPGRVLFLLHRGHDEVRKAMQSLPCRRKPSIRRAAKPPSRPHPDHPRLARRDQTSSRGEGRGALVVEMSKLKSVVALSDDEMVES